MVRWLQFAAVMLAMSVLSGHDAVAQQNLPQTVAPADPLSSTGEIDIAAATARVEALKAVAEPTPAQTAELELLQRVIDLHARQATATERITELEQRARTAPQRLSDLQEQLRATAPEVSEQVNQSASLDALKADLLAARAELSAAEQLQTTVVTEYAQRNDRRERIPVETAEATRRLEELTALLASAPDASDAPEVVAARRAAYRAEAALLQKQLELYDAEARSYEARRDLRRPREQLAELRVQRAQKLILALEQAVARKRETEIDRARRIAEETQDQATNPVTEAIAEQNIAYVVEWADVARADRELTELRAAAQAQYESLRDDFENMRQRVERGLLSGEAGRLRRQRSRLIASRVYERRLSEHRAELNRVQFRLDELSDASKRLADKQAAARTWIEAAETEGSVDGSNVETLVEPVRKALIVHDDQFLDPLYQSYDAYDKTLFTTFELEEKLLAVTREFRDFIDERILWIQSAPPLEIGDAGRSVEAARWLFSATGWRAVGEALAVSLNTRPFRLIGLLLILGALVVLRRPLRARLVQLGRRTTNPNQDHIGVTFGALAITLLLALPGPLALWLLAWQLPAGLTSQFMTAMGGSVPAATEAEEFVLAVAAGLSRVALLWYAAILVRLLLMDGGLADAHFHWREVNRRLVRRNLRWFVPLVLPLAFLHAVTNQPTFDNHHDSLGRVAFIVGMIASTAFLWRILNLSGGVLTETIRRRRGGWIERLRYFWFPLIVLTPLVLAIVAAVGYLYTAVQLEGRVLLTVWLILGAVIINAIMLRWLFITQRKLRIEQARKRLAAKLQAEAEQRRREAEAAAAAEESDGVTDPEHAPVTSAPATPSMEAILEEVNSGLDMQTISAQTRSLLRSGLGVGIVVGLALIWADVLPALGILRQVELPWQMEEMTMALTSQEGDAEVTHQMSERPATLADLMLGLVILIFTVVIGRNIPGLLEITILQRLPITAGGRYAVSTIVRYVIVIVGVILAFDAIGVGWSKVQWLAAAITVGLGFGLQEIFANFVSGIILLFEQPIRVGDTVTVNGINGTVSRIRMRATTVIDWDNKELVIPNKDFVTSQIINWSLSDSTTRVKIDVGIAYGSDVDLARKRLLEVAKESRIVLDKPPPQALFLGFGDNSLNFQLRVFIPHIDHFIPVRDQLHFAIDRAFRESGIEISFPQRDLHIRSSDVALFPNASADADRPPA